MWQGGHDGSLSSLEKQKQKDQCSAICNFCKASVTCKGGSTGAARKHIGRHPTELKKLDDMEKERDLAAPKEKKRKVDGSEPELVQPSLASFQKKFKMYGVHSGPQMTFDTAVVDMVACTGIPFNVLDHPTKG